MFAELIRLFLGDFPSIDVNHRYRFVMLITGDARGARVKHGPAIHQEAVVITALEQLNLTSAQIANVSARYAVLIQEANLAYQIGAIP
jgi:hypothetical protein